MQPPHINLDPKIFEAALLKTKEDFAHSVGRSRSHDKISLVDQPEEAEQLLSRLVAGLNSEKIGKDFSRIAKSVTDRMRGGALRIAFCTTRIRSQILHSSGKDIILLESGPKRMDEGARSEMLACNFMAQCRSVLHVARLD